MTKTYSMGSILLALGIAVVLLVLFGPDAHAQAVGTVGSLTCSNGAATGKLYDSGGSCPTTLGMDNFFSFLVCNVEQLSSNLMGHMFCGTVHELEPAVWAAITLAMVFFGISFTIGLIPATGREAILFLLKIGFVVAFATTSEVLIGYAYTFLVGGSREGITMALSQLGEHPTDPSKSLKTGADVYALLDGFLKKAFQFATDSMSGVHPKDMCKNAIFAVLATMTLAFPMISYLAALLMIRIAITFMQAVFGYICALVAITFLLTLAPFFVTFFMFKVTRPFFDKWLGYLVSFSLQMVLLFAFLAFIMSMNVSNLTSNISEAIVPKVETVEATAIRLPWEYCTLCEFKVVDKTTGADMAQSDPNFITQGKLKCKLYNNANPPQEVAAGGTTKPIDILFGAAPPQGAPSAEGSAGNALIKLAGNGIMSLIILAFIVERLLTLLPSLAQRLASAMGASYAPQMGGGFNPSGIPTMRMPGSGLMDDFGRGFQHEMTPSGGANTWDPDKGKWVSKNDLVSASAQHIKNGMAAMITGRSAGGAWMSKDAEDAPDYKKEDHVGLLQRTRRWITDPNGFKGGHGS